MKIISVTIGEGQTVEDLSLQIYGTVERVFDVLELAGIDNLDTDPIKGITFQYESQDAAIPSAINAAGYRFATRNPQIDSYFVRQDGGYLLRQDGGFLLRNE